MTEPGKAGNYPQIVIYYLYDEASVFKFIDLIFPLGSLYPSPHTSVLAII